MLKFSVITLFPELIKPHLTELPFKRALQNNLIEVNTHNLRDYAIDARGTVDDTPYGGGVGMILMLQPIYDALKEISAPKSKVVVLSAGGKIFDQQKARDFAKLDQITFLCGRYEGVDARVGELGGLLDIDIEEVSIGNYVLSGGEIPALAIMESVTRLLPGVLEKPEAVEIESFSDSANLIEYPQYTRPEDFKGLKVPDTLLTGNHAEIKKWREKNRLKVGAKS